MRIGKVSFGVWGAIGGFVAGEGRKHMRITTQKNPDGPLLCYEKMLVIVLAPVVKGSETI